MKANGFIKSIINGITKHEGTILTIATIGSTLAAVYFAAKDSPKLVAKLDELNEEEATNLEKAKAIAPIVARTAIATGASVGFALANHKFASDTISTLSNSLNVARLAKEEYKKHTEEIAGKEVADQVSNAVANSHAAASGVPEVSAPRIFQTGHGNSLFYDDWSGRWFTSDIAFIKDSVNSLNYQLMHDMYISLNEFYEYMDLPAIGSGKDFGWNVDYGTIELEFHAQLDDTDRAYTVITFQSEPAARWVDRRRW